MAFNSEKIYSACSRDSSKSTSSSCSGDKKSLHTGNVFKKPEGPFPNGARYKNDDESNDSKKTASRLRRLRSRQVVEELSSEYRGKSADKSATTAENLEQKKNAKSYWESEEPSLGSETSFSNESNQTYSRSGELVTSLTLIRKDHVIAGLFAILLGAFGVHKFYLGYNRAGFIILSVTVLGGVVIPFLVPMIMATISCVEGIIYLVRSQSEFEQTHVINSKEWF